MITEFFALVDFDLTKGNFEIINDKVYFVYHHDLDLNKIRTIRSGLLVGTIKNNRFEPSTSLALSLKKEQFKQVIDLKLDDVRVIKYLKRETLEVQDFTIQGYVLICVEGFPLGFGKVNDGILKNMYEVGFRWQ